VSRSWVCTLLSVGMAARESAPFLWSLSPLTPSSLASVSLCTAPWRNPGAIDAETILPAEVFALRIIAMRPQCLDSGDGILGIDRCSHQQYRGTVAVPA